MQLERGTKFVEPKMKAQKGLLQDMILNTVFALQCAHEKKKTLWAQLWRAKEYRRLLYTLAPFESNRIRIYRSTKTTKMVSFFTALLQF